LGILNKGIKLGAVFNVFIYKILEDIIKDLELLWDFLKINLSSKKYRNHLYTHKKSKRDWRST